MPDSPIVRPSFVARLWAGVLRVLDLAPAGLRMGADFAAGIPSAAAYDGQAALHAYGMPWVYAAVNAVATDLSALPIVVRRGAGADAVVVDRHPLLDVLRQPSERTSGRLWRRQLWSDLLLAGEAFTLIAQPGAPTSPIARIVPRLVGLRRLHPQAVLVEPDAAGEPAAYVYRHGGTNIRYDASRVLVVRMQSWESGPRSLRGLGASEALYHDLIADAALAKRSAASATAGRPAAFASPTGKDGLSVWPDRVIDAVKGAIARAFRESDGGVAVLGGAVEITPIGWSPTELQVSEQRTYARDTVIAALGVPGHRVGIPNANYATANAADLVYWQNLAGLVSMLDDELTRIVRLIPGCERDEVYHDLSRVDAMQPAIDARLRRAGDLVALFGAEPASALAWVGLADAPVAPASSPQSADQTARSWSWDAEAEASTVTRAATGAAWDRAMARVHAPAERMLLAAVRPWLLGARRRTIARWRTMAQGKAITRTISDEDLARIWPDAVERAEFRRALGNRLDRVLRLAFQAAARDIGRELPAYDPRDEAEAAIELLIERVNGTTATAIGDLIRAELAAGSSVAEVSAALQSAATFGPVRAMTIARTEATRTSNAGSIAAIGAAKGAGLTMRKRWLTARDEAVRDAHRALDGVEVDEGDRFRSGLHTASAPGDFGVGELDINCRCTIQPIVVEAP